MSEQRDWKGLWFTVPVALAALIPLWVQVRAPDEVEPVQMTAASSPARWAAPAPRERFEAHAASAMPPSMPAGGTSADATDPWSASASGLSTDGTYAALPPGAGPDPGSGVLGSGELPLLDGVVQPSITVDVRSSIRARIEAIPVDRGDYVQAGQEVVRLEHGVEAATVAVADARAAMTGELRSREANRELGLRRKERMDELFHRDAVSLELQDEVETDARVAEHEVRAARERREVAALELEQAREILARRRIASPVSGYVVDRHMSAGEVADEEVILSIAQVDPLLVEVIAPSSLYGLVEVGDVAEVLPELPPGARYEARVVVVDRVIDAASGTFGVRLELPNPDHAIPGGLRCQVRLLPRDADVAVAAPEPAPPAAAALP